MKRQKRDVVVTCSQEEGAVPRVADDLRKVGFEVESVLEFAGSVVGKWDEELDSLRQIPGVAAVEESQENYPL